MTNRNAATSRRLDPPTMATVLSDIIRVKMAEYYTSTERRPEDLATLDCYCAQHNYWLAKANAEAL